MKEKDIAVNRYVLLVDGRLAFVKYFGYIQGKNKRFVGLELIGRNAKGKNNGVVKGVRYFECPEGKGLMVSPKKLKRIFPKSKKKSDIMEEVRFLDIANKFPANGYNETVVQQVVKSCVHLETTLNGIFGDEIFRLIFEMTALLCNNNFVDIAGVYTFQKTYGVNLRKWNIKVYLNANGIYNLEGECINADYTENGYYEPIGGKVNFNCREAKGDAIGAIFHGTCFQNGPIVKRSVKLKDMKRFKV